MTVRYSAHMLNAHFLFFSHRIYKELDFNKFSNFYCFIKAIFKRHWLSEFGASALVRIRHLHVLPTIFAPLVQMSTQRKRQISLSIVMKIILTWQTPFGNQKVSGTSKGFQNYTLRSAGCLRRQITILSLQFFNA